MGPVVLGVLRVVAKQFKAASKMHCVAECAVCTEDLQNSPEISVGIACAAKQRLSSCVLWTHSRHAQYAGSFAE